MTKGETGRSSGGTYKAKYSEDVANYATMSLSALETEEKRLSAVSTNNYVMFTRAAASKSGSMVKNFANTDTQLKALRQVIRRKKNEAKTR